MVLPHPGAKGLGLLKDADRMILTYTPRNKDLITLAKSQLTQTLKLKSHRPSSVGR